MERIIRHWALWLAALLVSFSCGKEPLVPNDVVPGNGDTPIVFNLSADHPEDTKAKKSGWENGDVIFVFFTDVEAPKYLKMSYNGSSWSSTEMDGASTGSLNLTEGASGKMTAVYLPFGNGETVSKGENGCFVFSKIYYTYYLTASLNYQVTNHTVSGKFIMQIPEEYVQFFVPDASATDEAYSLGTDAVIPVGVGSVTQTGEGNAKEMKVNEVTSANGFKDFLTGYAYSSQTEKGYIFSGKRNRSYSYGKNYYFALRKEPEKTRKDFFIIAGTELQSHDAIRFAADIPWQQVGSDKTVTLTKGGTNLGTWNTCNHNTVVPNNSRTESYNSTLTGLPTKAQFQALVSNCKWYPVSLNDVKGVVVKADGNSFLFLPTNVDGTAYYWSQDHTGTNVQCLYISNGTPSIATYSSDNSNQGFVRLRTN